MNWKWKLKKLSNSYKEQRRSFTSWSPGNRTQLKLEMKLIGSFWYLTEIKVIELWIIIKINNNLIDLTFTLTIVLMINLGLPLGSVSELLFLFLLNRRYFLAFTSFLLFYWINKFETILGYTRGLGWSPLLQSRFFTCKLFSC